MQKLLHKLISIVGATNVLSSPDELLVYECDGLPQHKYRPRAVVFPSTTEQTSAVMRELNLAQVPYTPRGAGTGLSGGALALNEGVVVEMAKMRSILQIDAENRFAVVQPGVVNLQVSKAANSYGLYYVPDPSSQPTCTIGGNIAESAGGVHCLKYGTTTDHVLACRVVLANGDVVELGSRTGETGGYDLVGTFVGSEGTFGVVTEATLKLSQTPPGVRTLLAEFTDVSSASHAVSAIIAEGVMPAALEMMDHEIIRAVEASVFAAGLPTDIAAALLIELDGIDAGLNEEADRVTNICLQHGARVCRRARDENERKKLWAARKGAFGAIGRISPDSMIQDAVVPRSRLPEVLDAAYEISSKYQLKLANVFHAGDGNLHPLICFDSRFPEQVARVKNAGRELMEVCVAAGGTITGEHGVGFDKRELLPLVFSETDMDVMLKVRAAFDPSGLLNPGKIIPLLRGCGEGKATGNGNGSGLLQTTPQSNLVGSYETRAQGTQSAALSLLNNSSLGSTGIATQLGKIVGDNHVEISTSISVYPQTAAEISEILKLATAQRWTVLPAGSMLWIRATRSPDLIIKTSRLNQLLEHEPADLIARAESGVRLTDLNRALSEKGQWVPLDPPDDGTATIGGVVATGLGGTQQFAYGRPRGSVIGLKAVLADGRLVKMGGRVVKNVAGYDLSKLFTGSFGSLGVITEVNFKLRPRPQREVTVLARGPIDELERAGRDLINNRLFPVAVELVSETVLSRLGSSVGPGLLVRFAGNDKTVEFQTSNEVDRLREAKLEVELVEDDTHIWELIAALPISANFSARVSVLPTNLQSLCGLLAKLPSSTLWQAGVADGRIRIMNGDEGSHYDDHLAALRGVVEKSGGLLTIEQSNQEVGHHERFAIGNTQLEMIEERVKNQLDSLRLLPPPPSHLDPGNHK